MSIIPDDANIKKKLAKRTLAAKVFFFVVVVVVDATGCDPRDAYTSIRYKGISEHSFAHLVRVLHVSSTTWCYEDSNIQSTQIVNNIYTKYTYYEVYIHSNPSFTTDILEKYIQ